MTADRGAGPPARRRYGVPVALSTGALGATVLISGCAAGTSSKAAATPPARTPAVAPSFALPSFLPKPSEQPDSMLAASAARPALTTEGDSVRVQQPAGSVVTAVTGPEVPGEGLPYQTTATTCTWTVTMTGATATLPLDIAGFSTLDHLGTVYHPTLVPGQAAPPATVAPGQTISFELRAVMRTGEGLMRWAPTGSTVLASWDFEVETD